MHEAAGVRGRERARQLDADLDHVARGSAPCLTALPQCLALDELGH